MIATKILAVSHFAQVLRVATMAIAGACICASAYVVIHYFAKRRYPSGTDSDATARHVIGISISYSLFIVLVVADMLDKIESFTPLTNVAPIAFVASVVGLFSLSGMLRIQYGQWRERKNRSRPPD